MAQTNTENNHELISFVSARYVTGGNDETNESGGPLVVKAQAIEEPPSRRRGSYARHPHDNYPTSEQTIQVSASHVTAAPSTTAMEQYHHQQSNNNNVILVAPLEAGNHAHLPVAQATPIVRKRHGRRRYRYGHNGVVVKRVLSPQAQAFKERRQRVQAAALVAGGVAGGVLLGPLGGFILGFAVHGITKQVGRARQAKFEHRLIANAQNANESAAATAFSVSA